MFWLITGSGQFRPVILIDGHFKVNVSFMQFPVQIGNIMHYMFDYDCQEVTQIFLMEDRWLCKKRRYNDGYQPWLTAT